MRRLFFLFAFFLIGILFSLHSPSPPYANCDSITGFSITPSTGNTNTTQFTIKGAINNCSATAFSGNPAGVWLKGQNSTTGQAEPLIAGAAIAANGSFNTTFSLDKAGTWYISVYYGQTQLKSSDTNGNYQVTITVTDGKTKDLVCDPKANMGQVVKNAGAKDATCPSPCVKQQVPRSDVFACVTKEQQAQMMNTALGGCVTIDMVTKTCDTNYRLVTTSACSTSGEYTCGNNTASIMCYLDGQDKTPENLRCQTTDSNTSPTPTPTPPLPPCGSQITVQGCPGINSAFGLIYTDPQGFVTDLFDILLSISGGIALLTIIYSGYQLMISRGDQEKIKAARDRIISVFVGLLFMIFSFVILQSIGITIFNLPGFGK